MSKERSSDRGRARKRLRQDRKGKRERGSEGIGSATEKERARRIEGPTA